MTTGRDHEPPSLDELGRRLDRARKAAESGPTRRSASREFGVAYRVFVELLAGVAVGGVLGWFADGWLGTRPWLTLALTALGFAAGMANALRTARQMAAEAERGERISGDDSGR